MTKSVKTQQPRTAISNLFLETNGIDAACLPPPEPVANGRDDAITKV
jgi:hypothetical protein